MSPEEHQSGSGRRYDAEVRAWARELARGSTRTWADHLAAPAGAPAGGPAPSGPVPGAAQLELARRLAGRPDVASDPDFAGLVDLVLDTTGPGRGLLDVPLPWPGGTPGLGTPPVAPEDLPAEELLRVCTGVLARLLAAEPPAPRQDRSSPWRPWRRGVTLLGAPGTVQLVRSALLANGLREGGSRTTYLVLGGPVEDLMAQRWSARVRAGAGIRWQRMWRVAAAHDRLPPGIDMPSLAGQLADQVGPSRVHVVLGPDASTILRLAGEVLGVTVPPTALTDRHDALATDVLRRLNPVLTLAIGEAARAEVVATAWPEVAGDEDDGPLAAPAGQLAWAITAGERMAADLSRGRYPVHGDPALVVPTRRPGVRRAPAPDDVLVRALPMVGRAWRLRGRGAATVKGQD